MIAADIPSFQNSLADDTFTLSGCGRPSPFSGKWPSWIRLEAQGLISYMTDINPQALTAARSMGAWLDIYVQADDGQILNHFQGEVQRVWDQAFQATRDAVNDLNMQFKN